MSRDANSAPGLPPINEAGVAEEIGARADTVWTRGSGAAPATPRVATRELRGVGGRVAVVDGCRTPFSKSGTDLRDLDVVDLAGAAAAELVTIPTFCEENVARLKQELLGLGPVGSNSGDFREVKEAALDIRHS